MNRSKNEEYMTPNPVIGGNNYHESSQISSRNQTDSIRGRENPGITKLKKNTMVISKIKIKNKSIGSRRSALASSYIKKNKQK